MMLAEAIPRLIAGTSLAREESRACLRQIMEGKATPVQMAAFLTALRMKGETVEEITGAAEALRESAVPVRFTADVLVDTCGTGGDGKNTFNISTAVAFVVAGAGFPVAKHGNRSVSSSCGSADVLEELGIPVEWTAQEAERCLRDVGMAFLFAPQFHPAMKHAMPVRRELGVRTIFNLLGPLCNPARPNVQMVGVYDKAWVKPLAAVLARLGCRNGMVVHAAGHDEILPSGPATVAEIRDSRVAVRTWTPRHFGVRPEPRANLRGGSAADNARMLKNLLQGEKSSYRTAVCLNAAAVILAATREREGRPCRMTLKEAYRKAQDSIDQGHALSKLERLKQAMTAPARERHVRT